MNTNSCDQDTAVFMGHSLLNHAREIHNYAKTYCQQDTSEFQDKSTRRKSFICVERMLKEMYALMQMARYKGVDAFCNREQIDAYIDAAKAIIAPAQATFSMEKALLN